MISRKGLLVVVGLFLASACLWAAAFAAEAQPSAASKPGKVITLKYAGWNPPKGGVSVPAIKLMENIEKASGGRVKFEQHWMGSLIPAREEVEGVGKRIADMAQVMQPFQRRLSLMSVASLPGFGADTKEQGDNMVKLAELQAVKDQMAKHNLVIFAVHGGDPTHIMTKEPVRSLADLKGKKIRLVGEAAIVLKSLGAVPVGIVSEEMNEAFERGTIDGICSSLGGFAAYNLHEIGKYVTLMYLYSNEFYIIMNKNSWAALPEDIKKIMAKEAKELPKFYHDHILGEHKKAVQETYPRRGIKVFDLSAPDKAKVMSASIPVWDSWVKKIEAEGLPGKEVLARWKEWNGVK